MIICWINKGSCYLVWSEPPAFLCQSVSLPKLQFDNFDMSEVELKHDLNHWIVRVRRDLDPAGSWAAGPLLQPFSSKKAKLKFRLACSGSYPCEFWTHPRCQFLGLPVQGYCHGENCFLILQCLCWNELVLVLCSSGACPCQLHTLC